MTANSKNLTPNQRNRNASWIGFEDHSRRSEVQGRENPGTQPLTQEDEGRSKEGCRIVLSRWTKERKSGKSETQVEVRFEVHKCLNTCELQVWETQDEVPDLFRVYDSKGNAVAYSERLTRSEP